MALSFKSASQVLEEWFTRLRNLIPGVNLADDSDWTIRGKALSGVVEGVYADQEAIRKDIFPASARRPSLLEHANTWKVTVRGATPWIGTATFTAETADTVLNAGLRLVATESQRVYVTAETKTVTSGGTDVKVQSEASGSEQNLKVGAVLQFEGNPPTGIESSAPIASIISEARAAADDAEIAAAVLDKVQNPPAGGNTRDYERFPFEASTAVLSSFIARHPRGAGSVDVYVTSGTADIDAAVDAGDPVLRLPDQSILDTVQAYIDGIAPTTDDTLVKAPTETAIAVTVKVTPSDGLDLATVTPIVQKEVERVLYKLLPDSAQPVVVRGSRIEKQVGLLEGRTLKDWQVDELDPGGEGANKTLATGALASPGVITVVAL